MPLSFGGWGLCEKFLWILITFIDYITRHSFRGYTHISRSQHDIHTDTRQPQTTLTNHSFIESLASSGAAWVTISKHIYNIYIILSINYTMSIHYDSFIVKSFRK